jgi:uncharacterized membrane protein YtjA (UPF0391 family)
MFALIAALLGRSGLAATYAWASVAALAVNAVVILATRLADGPPRRVR